MREYKLQMNGNFNFLMVTVLPFGTESIGSNTVTMDFVGTGWVARRPGAGLARLIRRAAGAYANHNALRFILASLYIYIYIYIFPY